jgi:aryl-alcohol dehydrogenase-like predicted oxidoreductase
MNFGNQDFGCDEATSLQIIHAYLDAGHNFIDTANVYSGTLSETIVGKAVRGAGTAPSSLRRREERSAPAPSMEGRTAST